MILKSGIKKPASAVRAFSLMELAIVLGIMGIILSGLWGVVSHVRENMRREMAFDTVLQVVKSVRVLYQGQSEISTAMSDDALTDRVIRQGAIPPDMIRNHNAGVLQADHAWGPRTNVGSGSFLIGRGADGQHFQVKLRDLPFGSCIEMVTRLSQDGGPPGLDSVAIGGFSTSTVPVAVSVARLNCAKTQIGSTVSFAYRLRQQ